MKIAAPNVFIGFGLDIIEKIMSDSYKYSNLVKDLEEDTDAGLLFSVENNPNFISFEHQIGLGADSKSQMILKLIDPTRQFERRFISSNIIDSIFNKNSMNILSDMAKYSSGQSEAPEDENYNLLASKYLLEQVSKTSRRHLYICYGFGDNLKNWAGPYAVTITASKIELEGSRVLTLFLTPSNTTLDKSVVSDAQGNTPDVPNNGYKRQIIGYSRPITFDGFESMEEYKLQGLPTEIDFHLLLIDTLKSFITKASQLENAIVLLPDINQICKTYIDSVINKYDTSVQVPNGSGGIPGNQTAPDYFSVFNPYEIFYKNLKIVDEVFKRFGLELATTQKDTTTISTGADAKQRESFISDDTNEIEAIKSYVNDNTYFIIASCELKNHEDALNYLLKVITNINGCGDVSQIIPEYAIENNLHILRFWKSDLVKESFTFRRSYGAGEDLFSENEVNIFADKDLMTKYLFCTEESNPADTDSVKPLYSKDRNILASPRYKSRMQKILQRSDEDFYGLYKFPDDFALNYSNFGVDAQDLDQISKLKFPIFKYNTQNPNITSLSFLNSEVYATTLNSSYKKYLTTLAQKSEQASTNINDLRRTKIKTQQELAKYIKSHFVLNYTTPINPNYLFSLLDENFKKNFGIGNEILVGDIKRSDPTKPYSEDELLIHIEALSLILRNPSVELLPELNIEQFTKQDARIVFLDFLKQVSDLLFQVEIDTVPIFSVNNIGHIGKPCILLCQNSDIIQNTKRVTLDTTLRTLGSGKYKIARFRHVITGTDCKSSFLLFKGDLSENTNLPTNFQNNKEEEDTFNEDFDTFMDRARERNKTN